MFMPFGNLLTSHILTINTLNITNLLEQSYAPETVMPLLMVEQNVNDTFVAHQMSLPLPKPSNQLITAASVHVRM